MQRGIVVIAEGGGDASLGLVGVAVKEGVADDEENGQAGLAGKVGGRQAGYSRADDQHVGCLLRQGCRIKICQVTLCGSCLCLSCLAGILIDCI